MMKKMLTKNIFIPLFAVLIFSVVPVQATGDQDTITMAFWNDPADDVNFKYAELFYSEAFKRLGLRFRYKVYVPIRASIEANRGNVDGEPARIRDHNTIYKNLIRVEEPVIVIQVNAYAIDPNIKINTWEDLQGKAYRIEYYRGIAIVEKRLIKLVEPERLTTISNPVQSLKKLILNRIDLFIDVHGRVGPLLKTSQFKEYNIRVSGQLEQIEIILSYISAILNLQPDWRR